MANHYDVIVVGLGALGSAALFHLSQMKQFARKKLLGIEQYHPLHQMGSSHGDTRITRLALGEYPAYSLTAIRSHDIWKDIAHKTQGKFGKIYSKTGGLIIGSPHGSITLPGLCSNFIQQTLSTANQFQIKHRLLSSDDIKKAYPQFVINEYETAYYEEEMGILNPEVCINSQLALAKSHGAEIHFPEKLLTIEMGRNNRPCLITDRNTYQANKIILSMGAWILNVLPPIYKKYFTIYRKCLCWFKVNENTIEQFMPKNLPVFVRILENGVVVYGFPIWDDNNTVKFGFDDNSIYQIADTPESVDRTISLNEMQYYFESYISPYFSGITNHCYKANVCLYTSTVNRKFVVDYLPHSNEHIILASACSGHGFKHSTAIGEAIAQLLAKGSSDIDVFNIFGWNNL